MTCERCDGLMVSEQICDLQGMNSDLCVNGYRCLLCGNLVDTVILENRSRSTDAVEPIMFRDPRMQAHSGVSRSDHRYDHAWSS